MADSANRIQFEFILNLTILIGIVMCVTAYKLSHTFVPYLHNFRYLEDIQWKTGDIVLFHSNPAINFVLSSVWSHVALVIVPKRPQNSQPFMLDITSSTRTPAVRPLLPILMKEFWTSTRTVAYRSIAHSLDNDTIATYLQTNTLLYNHHYWKVVFNRLFGSFFMQFDKTGERTTFCSELIHDTLLYCSAVKDTHRKVPLPGDFCENGDEPVELLDNMWSDTVMLKLRSTQCKNHVTRANYMFSR